MKRTLTISALVALALAVFAMSTLPAEAGRARSGRVFGSFPVIKRRSASLHQDAFAFAANSGAIAKPESEPKPESNAKSEAEPKPESNAKSESEPKPESIANPEPGTSPDTRPWAEPQIQTQPRYQTLGRAQSQPRYQTRNKFRNSGRARPLGGLFPRRQYLPYGGAFTDFQVVPCLARMMVLWQTPCCRDSSMQDFAERYNPNPGQSRTRPSWMFMAQTGVDTG